MLPSIQPTWNLSCSSWHLGHVYQSSITFTLLSRKRHRFRFLYCLWLKFIFPTFNPLNTEEIFDTFGILQTMVITNQSIAWEFLLKNMSFYTLYCTHNVCLGMIFWKSKNWDGNGYAKVSVRLKHLGVFCLFIVINKYHLTMIQQNANLLVLWYVKLFSDWK